MPSARRSSRSCPRGARTRRPPPLLPANPASAAFLQAKERRPLPRRGIAAYVDPAQPDAHALPEFLPVPCSPAIQRGIEIAQLRLCGSIPVRVDPLYQPGACARRHGISPLQQRVTRRARVVRPACFAQLLAGFSQRLLARAPPEPCREQQR